MCVCAAVLKRPPGSRGEPCIERRAGAQGRRRREGLRGHRAPQGPGPPDPPPEPVPRREPGPAGPNREPEGLPESPGAARPPGRCGRSRGRAAALGGCELFPAENERSEVSGRCYLICLVHLLHVCVKKGRGGYVAIAGAWSVMRTRFSCAAFQSHSPLLGGIYK